MVSKRKIFSISCKIIFSCQVTIPKEYFLPSFPVFVFYNIHTNPIKNHKNFPRYFGFSHVSNYFCFMCRSQDICSQCLTLDSIQSQQKALSLLKHMKIHYYNLFKQQQQISVYLELQPKWFMMEIFHL